VKFSSDALAVTVSITKGRGDIWREIRKKLRSVKTYKFKLGR